MQGSPIDIVIFAPLAAILGVLLFWFIQLLFIQCEKYLLSILKHKHESLVRFTNFLGILFQTICHALGYTVTRSGISDVYLSVDYSKVAPKKEKKGMFEWISNVFLFIGPFFIPAVLLLIFLFFLIHNGFEVTTPSQLLEIKYTFSGQIATFGNSLYVFSNSFFTFLFNIDLLHPAHFGFLILMIFMGLGIRPSYFGEKKKEKVDMIYDLRNIWQLVSNKPVYPILLFLIAYVFFYISFYLDQIWYVALFSILGWLSIISITSVFIANLLLLLVKNADEITGRLRYLPYITIPLIYVLMRLLFYYFPSDYTNSVSLLVTILVTCLVVFLLLRKKTNKFKTKKRIKLFKKEKEKNEEEER